LVYDGKYASYTSELVEKIEVENKASGDGL
jgi:hypothetical protein